MKALNNNAARAREILKREQSPLSAEGYFSLLGPVSIKIEKGDSYRISIEAEANEIKPFGVIRY